MENPAEQKTPGSALYSSEVKKMQPGESLRKLQNIDREIQLLVHTAALLQWDQETGMPSEAIGERADQIALLEGLIHDRLTSGEAGDLLRDAGFTGAERISPDEDGAERVEKAFIRSFGRAYERAAKLPRRLVTEMAQAASQSQAAWIEARKNSDFGHFQPHLERILSLVTEKAAAIGYKEQPYDALLDEFEPGMLTSHLKPVFEKLREQLSALVGKIVSFQDVDDSFRYRSYSPEKQREFSLEILRDMGYDFKRGRLDESAHPFTTSLGGSDIRITTHYKEKDLLNALFGTIHEGGHGLYELGIDPKLHGTILGEGTSLGIHESQSRTWENLIGRSPFFWKHYFPRLRDVYFPEELSDISEMNFIRGINKVERSLIRINADEVTYSLHVILRFELELAMLNGDLQVKDLPQAWNEGMRRLLGTTPPDDAAGVLQDVHWSMGAIGYFPTYALGNLYGAQFLNTLRQDIPEMDQFMSNGKFLEIREWQREHIHSPGSIFTAEELCLKVTGEALNPDYFISYLERKFHRLYDV